MLVLHWIVWLISSVFILDSSLYYNLISYSISSELVLATVRIQSSPARQVIFAGTGLSPCSVSKTQCNFDSPISVACSWPGVRIKLCPQSARIQIPKRILRERRRKILRRHRKRLADIKNAIHYEKLRERWSHQDELSRLDKIFDGTLGYPGEG